MSNVTLAGRTCARNNNPVPSPQIGRPNGVTEAFGDDRRPHWGRAPAVGARVRLDVSRAHEA